LRCDSFGHSYRDLCRSRRGSASGGESHPPAVIPRVSFYDLATFSPLSFLPGLIRRVVFNTATCQFGFDLLSKFARDVAAVRLSFAAIHVAEQVGSVVSFLG
jgi:hypothetical protein